MFKAERPDKKFEPPHFKFPAVLRLPRRLSFLGYEVTDQKIQYGRAITNRGCFSSPCTFTWPTFKVRLTHFTLRNHQKVTAFITIPAALLVRPVRVGLTNQAPVCQKPLGLPPWRPAVVFCFKFERFLWWLIKGNDCFQVCVVFE